MLKRAEVQISMDGRGRCFDNIMVERLWRSVKYKEVYLKDYQQVRDAREGLGAYFRFYNLERSHQSLGYRTPYEAYHGLDWGAGDGAPVGPKPKVHVVNHSPSPPAAPYLKVIQFLS